MNNLLVGNLVLIFYLLCGVFFSWECYPLWSRRDTAFWWEKIIWVFVMTIFWLPLAIVVKLVDAMKGKKGEQK